MDKRCQKQYGSLGEHSRRICRALTNEQGHACLAVGAVLVLIIGSRQHFQASGVLSLAFLIGIPQQTTQHYSGHFHKKCIDVPSFEKHFKGLPVQTHHPILEICAQ